MGHLFTFIFIHCRENGNIFKDLNSIYKMFDFPEYSNSDLHITKPLFVKHFGFHLLRSSKQVSDIYNSIYTMIKIFFFNLFFILVFCYLYFFVQSDGMNLYINIYSMSNI